jgi:hypothetical protein
MADIAVDTDGAAAGEPFRYTFIRLTIKEINGINKRPQATNSYPFWLKTTIIRTLINPRMACCGILPVLLWTTSFKIMAKKIPPVVIAAYAISSLY